MEELFNFLSSSARLNKQKRPRSKQTTAKVVTESTASNEADESSHPRDDFDSTDNHRPGPSDKELASRDRTGKRDWSDEKRDQVQREQIAAFRRSMGIRVANYAHEPHLPDPLSSFHDLSVPSWWEQQHEKLVNHKDERNFSFEQLRKTVLLNIEKGRWKEPTPIQMQAIPCLLERRDLIGAACTGSGKSGAFILPTIFLTSAPTTTFYGGNDQSLSRKKKSKSLLKAQQSRQGEIRGLILAPSTELAAQLHRECERLGMNLPGGYTSLLLSKSNAANVIAGSVGGKKGLDVLVATPLRLVDSIQKGLRLNAVRIVVMDESDRLLDAADGKSVAKLLNSDGDADVHAVSGSAQSLSFLSQMDSILAEIPQTAIRALFSATVTPTVRSLAESFLRNPIDLTIRSSTAPGGANPDIQQKLMFVGREEGKLLAIRQLVQRGELRPPVIIFLQTKERAQALFSELLYDGIHVDVIHAGRSKSARDTAVAKFRRGDTWVLIATDLVARGVDFRAVNMVINYDLPESGITYIHRIGRCGRAGRKGDAITLFTEADFPNLRTIANVMKQSGCPVEDWMLELPSSRRGEQVRRKRQTIDTTPRYDMVKKRKKRDMIAMSKKKRAEKEKDT